VPGATDSESGTYNPEFRNLELRNQKHET